jgi:hypothetical protein
MYPYFDVLLFYIILMFSEKVACFACSTVSRNRNKPFQQKPISDLQEHFRKSAPNKEKSGLTVSPKKSQSPE